MRRAQGFAPHHFNEFTPSSSKWPVMSGRTGTRTTTVEGFGNWQLFLYSPANLILYKMTMTISEVEKPQGRRD